MNQQNIENASQFGSCDIGSQYTLQQVKPCNWENNKYRFKQGDPKLSFHEYTHTCTYISVCPVVWYIEMSMY